MSLLDCCHSPDGKGSDLGSVNDFNLREDLTTVKSETLRRTCFPSMQDASYGSFLVFDVMIRGT